MTLFRVHFDLSGSRQTADVRAETPKAAADAIKHANPSAVIIKTKSVRAE